MKIIITQQKEDKNVSVFEMMFAKDIPSMEFIKDLIDLVKKYDTTN